MGTRRILVTGGTGFIARTAAALLAGGYSGWPGAQLAVLGYAPDLLRVRPHGRHRLIQSQPRLVAASCISSDCTVILCRTGSAAPSEGQGIMEVRHVRRIDGALLFTPQPHVDERGFFSRTFDADITRSAGIDPAAFVQDSLSRSARGVIRGMHLRSGLGESKLVRCTYGMVFDVVVDLRPASPTYGNWQSFELTDKEQVTLYVPAGCAHGFQALTDPADVSYRIDRPHDSTEDLSIAFDDPELAIPWPLPVLSCRSETAKLPHFRR